MNNISNEFKGLAIVGFIDILGFSKDIQNNWDKPTDSFHPLKKILNIKEDAKNINKQLEEASGNLPDDAHVVISSISDSFVIRCSLESKSVHSNGDVSQKAFIETMRIYSVIRTMVALWVSCINNGYTIRGAISVGDVYWDNHSLIGSAYIDTYKLESEVAKNSRILISTCLNLKLRELFGVTCMNESHQQWLEKLRFHLRKDVDGYIIVNLKSSFNDDSSKIENIVNLLETIKQKAPKGAVREKYTPLINMLKSDFPNLLTIEDFGNY